MTHAAPVSARRAVATAVAVMAIASGHLIEDYLYGVHHELGFDTISGMFLAMAYYAIFGALIAQAAQANAPGSPAC